MPVVVDIPLVFEIAELRILAGENKEKQLWAIGSCSTLTPEP